MHACISLSALDCGCDTWGFCLGFPTVMDDNLELQPGKAPSLPYAALCRGWFIIATKTKPWQTARRDGLCQQHSAGQLLHTVAGSEMSICKGWDSQHPSQVLCGSCRFCILTLTNKPFLSNIQTFLRASSSERPLSTIHITIRFAIPSAACPGSTVLKIKPRVWDDAQLLYMWGSYYQPHLLYFPLQITQSLWSQRTYYFIRDQESHHFSKF